jgi:cytochrome oxidase Cu insertion factor (SCO1/SenC/PrrC family)
MTDTVGRPSPGGAGANSVDRAAAFAAGPTRIPRRFVHWMLFAAAVLGIGGALLEHVLSAAGINPTAPATTTPATTTPAPTTTVLQGAIRETKVPGKLAAFMALSSMTGGEARPFSLIDEHGQALSLADERGKVVVLSFFDGRCNDICPVVAAEIVQADARLGPLASRVSFLTVNTDPGATAVSGLDPVLSRTGLGRLANWHMLTGPVAELNAVWLDYGITVTYDTATRTVEHNDAIYFLDESGRFRYGATPSANELRPSGTYVLAEGDIARFATGIATYVGQLVAGT